MAACAPVDAYALLGEPRAFAQLLGPAQRLRSFDAGWPAAGAEARFSVGLGPIGLPDVVTVVTGERDRLLAVGAALAGIGRLHIRFELEPAVDGTRVTVVEQATHGLLAVPACWPVVARAIHWRDAALIQRLSALGARLAAQRRSPAARDAPI